MGGDTRINFELPPIPHSFRDFVENTVKSDRGMRRLIESPLTALRAAGVPIAESSLTKADIERLVMVLGKLRNLVNSKKLPKDFRFEDIFNIADDVAFCHSTTESDSYTSTEFTPKTQTETSKKTTQGCEKKWGSSWLNSHFNDQGIHAPMISPKDLTNVLTRMDAKLNSIAQKNIR